MKKILILLLISVAITLSSCASSFTGITKTDDGKYLVTEVEKSLILGGMLWGNYVHECTANGQASFSCKTIGTGD